MAKKEYKPNLASILDYVPAGVKTKMLEQKSKTTEQINIALEWYTKGANGIVEAPTAFGKSFLAAIVIKAANVTNSKLVSHIVVPTESIKNRMKDIVKEFELSNVEIFIINTYAKEADTMECDILIIDEVHRSAAVKFINIYKAKRKATLGLTATLLRNDLRHKMIPMPLIKKLTERTSYANQWSHKPKDIVVEIELTEKERVLYNNTDERYKNTFKFFNRNFGLVKSSLSGMQVTDTYENRIRFKGFILNSNDLQEDRKVKIHVNTAAMLAHQYKEANPNSKITEGSVKGLARTVFSSIRQRGDIIKQAENKVYKTLSLIRENKDKRILVFCSSINIVQYLYNILKKEGVKITIYHSKLKKEEKDNNLNDFKKGNVNIILSVYALDEGIDVPEIDTTIVMYGHSQKRQGIQRKGRASRKPGSIEYNLICRNTHEEDVYRRRS